jgi:hypothetical protein
VFDRDRTKGDDNTQDNLTGKHMYKLIVATLLVPTTLFAQYFDDPYYQEKALREMRDQTDILRNMQMQQSLEYSNSIQLEDPRDYISGSYNQAVTDERQDAKHRLYPNLYLSSKQLKERRAAQAKKNQARNR